MDDCVWVAVHPPVSTGGQVPPEVFEDREQAEEWARLGNMNPGARWEVFPVICKDLAAAQRSIDYNRAVLREMGLLRERMA